MEAGIDEKDESREKGVGPEFTGPIGREKCIAEGKKVLGVLEMLLVWSKNIPAPPMDGWESASY